MGDRSTRMLVLGIVVGACAALLIVAGPAGAWGWRFGAAAYAKDIIVLPVSPAQSQPLNPNEFVPIPNPQNGQGPGPQAPGPGAGGQDCDKILYFYQGRLYQLRPGPMPRGGGNPEFYFMQPYEGPQIPGFPIPGPMTPEMPGPGMPGQLPRHI